MNQLLSRYTMAAALVLGAGLAIPAAVAQPAPMSHHGGRAGHGPQGAGIEQALLAVKSELKLNTSQQLQWDNAVAGTRAALETGRSNLQAVQAAMKVEVAKAEPDLAAVAMVADDAHARNDVLRRQTRDAWLQVYATFSPEQKAIAREAIKQKMSRMEGFKAHFREGRGS